MSYARLAYPPWLRRTKGQEEEASRPLFKIMESMEDMLLPKQEFEQCFRGNPPNKSLDPKRRLHPYSLGVCVVIYCPAAHRSDSTTASLLPNPRLALLCAVIVVPRNRQRRREEGKEKPEETDKRTHHSTRPGLLELPSGSWRCPLLVEQGTDRRCLHPHAFPTLLQSPVSAPPTDR